MPNPDDCKHLFEGLKARVLAAKTDDEIASAAKDFAEKFVSKYGKEEVNRAIEEARKWVQTQVREE